MANDHDLDELMDYLRKNKDAIMAKELNVQQLVNNGNRYHKEEIRFALDTLSINNPIKVISLRDILLKLRAAARLNNLLIYYPTDSINQTNTKCEIQLVDDCFKVEIILGPQENNLAKSTAIDAKIFHSDRVVSCPEIVSMIRNNEFCKLQAYLAELHQMYPASLDESGRKSLLMAFQSLEIDVDKMDHFYKNSNPEATPLDLVRKGSVGLLSECLIGRPRKIMYFVTPKQLMLQGANKCFATVTSKIIDNFGFQAEVAVTTYSTSCRLPYAPLITSTHPVEGTCFARFGDVTHANSVCVNACFVFRLKPPIPVLSSIAEKITTETGIRVFPPNKKMSRFDSLFFTESDDITRMSFPSGEAINFRFDFRHDRGMLVDEVYFTHPKHLMEIITQLRHQLYLNALISSCVTKKKCEPQKCKDNYFEMKFSKDLSLISINFEHPLSKGSIAVAEIQFSPSGYQTCNLCCARGDPKLCEDSLMKKKLNLGFHLPITMNFMLTTAKEKSKDKEVKPQEKIQQSSNIYNQTVNNNKRPVTSQPNTSANRFSSPATEAPAKISQHPILSDLLQPKLPPPTGVQTQKHPMLLDLLNVTKSNTFSNNPVTVSQPNRAASPQKILKKETSNQPPQKHLQATQLLNPQISNVQQQQLQTTQTHQLQQHHMQNQQIQQQIQNQQQLQQQQQIQNQQQQQMQQQQQIQNQQQQQMQQQQQIQNQQQQQMQQQQQIQNQQQMQQQQIQNQQQQQTQQHQLQQQQTQQHQLQQQQMHQQQQQIQPHQLQQQIQQQQLQHQIIQQHSPHIVNKQLVGMSPAYDVSSTPLHNTPSPFMNDHLIPHSPQSVMPPPPSYTTAMKQHQQHIKQQQIIYQQQITYPHSHSPANLEDISSPLTNMTSPANLYNSQQITSHLMSPRPQNTPNTVGSATPQMSPMYSAAPAPSPKYPPINTPQQPGAPSPQMMTSPLVSPAHPKHLSGGVVAGRRTSRHLSSSLEDFNYTSSPMFSMQNSNHSNQFHHRVLLSPAPAAVQAENGRSTHVPMSHVNQLSQNQDSNSFKVPQFRISKKTTTRFALRNHLLERAGTPFPYKSSLPYPRLNSKDQIENQFNSNDYFNIQQNPKTPTISSSPAHMVHVKQPLTYQQPASGQHALLQHQKSLDRQTNFNATSNEANNERDQPLSRTFSNPMFSSSSFHDNQDNFPMCSPMHPALQDQQHLQPQQIQQRQIIQQQIQQTSNFNNKDQIHKHQMNPQNQENQRKHLMLKQQKQVQQSKQQLKIDSNYNKPLNYQRNEEEANKVPTSRGYLPHPEVSTVESDPFTFDDNRNPHTISMPDSGAISSNSSSTSTIHRNKSAQNPTSSRATSLDATIKSLYQSSPGLMSVLTRDIPKQQKPNTNTNKDIRKSTSQDIPAAPQKQLVRQNSQNKASGVQSKSQNSSNQNKFDSKPTKRKTKEEKGLAKRRGRPSLTEKPSTKRRKVESGIAPSEESGKMVISKVSDSWTIKNKPTFPNIQSLNDNNQVTTAKNTGSNSLNFSNTTSVCTSSTSTTTNTASTTNSWVQNYVKAQQSKKRKFGGGNYSQQQQQKGRTQTSNSSNSSRGAQFSNTIKSTSNHLIQKTSSSNSLNVQNQSKNVSGRSRKNSLKEVVDKLNIKAEHVVNVTTTTTATSKLQHGRQSPATGVSSRSSTPTQGHPNQRCSSFTDFSPSSRTKGYNNSNTSGNKQLSNLSTKISGRPLPTGSTNSKLSMSGKTSARNSPILKASIPSTTSRLQSVGGNSGTTSNKSTKLRPTVSRPLSKSPTVISKPSTNCKSSSSVLPPNVSLYKKSADVSAFKTLGTETPLLNSRLTQRPKPPSSSQQPESIPKPPNTQTPNPKKATFPQDFLTSKTNHQISDRKQNSFKDSSTEDKLTTTDNSHQMINDVSSSVNSSTSQRSSNDSKMAGLQAKSNPVKISISSSLPFN